MKKPLFIIIAFITLTSFTCSKNRVILKEGQVSNDMFYLDGEIKPFTGVCIIPFEDGKSVKEVRKFKDGIVDGEAMSYFSDGTLKRKGFYKDGRMNGLWEQWFDNGKIAFRAIYKNDSMSGCFKEWYANGKVKEEGQLFNDERVGVWRFYDESGNLNYEKEYNNFAQPLKQPDQIQCI